MENNNCLMFEMKVLQDLRKMKPEQRKELLSSLEKEEQLEQEELKKNPNLPLERQIKQVLGELKDIRQELQGIKHNNTLTNNDLYIKQCPIKKLCPVGKLCNIDINLDEQSLPDDNTDDYSLFSMDMIPFWLFLLFVIISLITPNKPSIRPFSI
jgi:hypothetical protein